MRRLFIIGILACLADAQNATTTAAASAGATSTTTTPVPTTPAPFCINCGFDFGQILPGVDDKTAGMVLVAIIVVVLIAIACICACCLHNSCYRSDYQRVNSKQDGGSV